MLPGLFGVCFVVFILWILLCGGLWFGRLGGVCCLGVTIRLVYLCYGVVQFSGVGLACLCVNLWAYVVGCLRCDFLDLCCSL